jgi:hypothetical protein
MDSATQTAAMTPQKFSRYRSVRIAATKEPAPPPQVPTPPAQDTIKRSMSRYRHARAKTAERIPVELATVAKPPIPPSPPKARHREPSSRRVRDAASGPVGTRDVRGSNGTAAHLESARTSIEPSRSYPTRRRPTNEAVGEIPTRAADETPGICEQESPPLMILNEAQREAYAILNDDRNRTGKLGRKQRDSIELVIREAQTPQGMGARNLQISGSQSSDEDRQVRSTVHGKERAKTLRKEAPLARDPREASSAHEEVIGPRPRTASVETTQTPMLAGQTTSAGIDAPLSAVNARERNILVNCNDSTINLPVTLHTTVADILNSAANQFANSADAQAMMLVESFKQLGLERFLRRYEYVREVLNSWDHDDQNTLLAVSSPADGSGTDLDLKGAPTVQPTDVSVYLYHSQKPGTWDKRWITLRADGQVVIARDKDSTDSKNICHMSDFDIYTPTSRQMKRLHPPKKYCFAMKSQQKSAMFISTANFVHFCATKDKALAATWYKAVQAWRSWYLVHIMGNGQKPQATVQPGALAGGVQSPADTPRQRQRSRTMGSARRPTDLSRSSLSSTQDVGDFRLPPAPPNALPSRLKYSKSVRPSRDRTAPPVSFPKSFAELSPISSTVAQNPGPLSSQGVAHREPLEDLSSPVDILNRAYGQEHKITHPKPESSGIHKEPSGINRSFSKHQKPVPWFAPLVDLTPKYQDLPQHIKKGHGVIPDHVPAGGLVEIATSPNLAVEIPPLITHRKPEPTRGGGGGRQRTATMTSTKAPLLAHSSPTDDETFPSGLLARFDAVRKEGRGVASGERQAGEPLLDLQEPSRFVPGSLLASVEKQVGDSGPRIDRGKQLDGVLMAYGEAG